MPDVKEPASGRREQRRRRHQLLSREQLLDAAEEIFGRKGYHDTTLKEVAELAEFSVGSVYSFFDNKDDLFRQIFLRRGEEFMPELRATLADEHGTPLERLHRLVEFQVRWFREHPHFGCLYLRHPDPRLMDATIEANYAGGDAPRSRSSSGAARRTAPSERVIQRRSPACSRA